MNRPRFTVRVSPLEDTVVALRPTIPKLPWEIPNSVRVLDPMMPVGSTSSFNNVDVNGNPVTPIVNKLVNFGWEYVYHCHILSHEEMDMMRPMSLALPPNKADGLAASVTGTGRNQRVQVAFNDNSISETSYALQRSTDGTTWATVGTSDSPLNQPNIKGARTILDSVTTTNVTAPAQYRVLALNTVGYGGQMPSMTAQSASDVLGFNPPAAPTNLVAVGQAGPAVKLTWTDAANNEAGYTVQRAVGTGAFTTLTTLPAKAGSGTTMTITDITVALGNTYSYKVVANNVAGSGISQVVTVVVAVPGTPGNVTATVAGTRTSERITVSWSDNANNETGQTVQWSTDGAVVAGTKNLAANVTNYTTPNLIKQVWWVRVGSTNVYGTTWSGWVRVPAAP